MSHSSVTERALLFRDWFRAHPEAVPAYARFKSYIAAFERSDAGLLDQVLRTDATLEATPFRDWQSGRAMCVHILGAYVLGTPGDRRMIATTANPPPSCTTGTRTPVKATKSGVPMVVKYVSVPAPLGAHNVRSASVGERRAARKAGSRPAIAPITIAAPIPPTHAWTGMTTAQPFAFA
jgi:hypothetical protein